MKIIANSLLNDKSQLVTPKKVRDILKIGPGDIMLFVDDGTGNIIIKKGKVQVEDTIWKR